MDDKHRILVVDDDSENRQFLLLALENDYDVKTAESGEEGLAQLHQFQPEIVILDIMRPGVGGFEVCRRIRADEEFKGIKILLATAKTSLPDRQKGYKAGADDYIIKPFAAEELAAKINVFIRATVEENRRKQVAGKLQAANEELQVLSETGALVANVVHDATKFTTAMSMTMEEHIIPPLRENLVQSDDWVMDLMNNVIEMHSNSIQCTKFLESLLAITRINDDIEPVGLVNILQQAFSLLSYNLMQDGIEWSLKFDPDCKMMVFGNAQLIRVFMNLIANANHALKRFETDDPRVTVNISDKAEEIKVSVHDNGPGIKPDVLAGIRKGLTNTNPGQGGNGFGVSGASRIIQTLNGTIDIKSEIGNGAEFIVTLPKAPEEKAEEVDLEGIDLF